MPSMSGDSCFILLLLLFGTFSNFCEAQKKNNYCSVCRIIIQEVEWVISQVDPKTSIQTGSFRVDSDGNQKIVEKPYARSNVHLEEVFETVCSRMHFYAELTAEDGTKQMVRTIGFNGETLGTKDLNLDREKRHVLKYQCEYFIEDHEEEVISLMQQSDIPDYGKLICGEELAVCTEEKLSIPFPTLPEVEDEDVEINDDENGVDYEEEDDEEGSGEEKVTASEDATEKIEL